MNLLAIEHELRSLLKQRESGPRYARIMRLLRKACHAREQVFVKEGKRWSWATKCPLDRHVAFGELGAET